MFINDWCMECYWEYCIFEKICLFEIISQQTNIFIFRIMKKIESTLFNATRRVNFPIVECLFFLMDLSQARS